jgi:hypothetical protein
MARGGVGRIEANSDHARARSPAARPADGRCGDRFIAEVQLAVVTEDCYGIRSWWRHARDVHRLIVRNLLEIRGWQNASVDPQCKGLAHAAELVMVPTQQCCCVRFGGPTVRAVQPDAQLRDVEQPAAVRLLSATVLVESALDRVDAP